MSRISHSNLVFKALADQKRREILDLLKIEERTTGDLCRHFKKLDRCTVMLHLGVLDRAGLIIVKRSGRERWNYLNPIPIKEIFDRWISRYALHAVSILQHMKHSMEKRGEKETPVRHQETFQF